MIFADLKLARRLEAMEALGCEAYAQAHLIRHPEVKSTSLKIMGGIAVFAGMDSPITQAFGLGMAGEVTDREMDELEEFYRAYESPVNIEVCPLADFSLMRILNERGYLIVEHSNVLYRELANVDHFDNDPISVRGCHSQESDHWAKTVTLGFIETADPDPVMQDIATSMFKAHSTVPLLIEKGEQTIGGGALAINEGLVNLFAHATIPEFRRLGAQSALIAASLEYAQFYGCDLAMGTTMCGTASQHNFERQGFRIAYTRTKFTSLF